MKILQTSDQFEYEMRGLLLSFYPGEPIEVVTCPAEEMGEADLTVKITPDGEKALPGTAEIALHGVTSSVHVPAGRKESNTAFKDLLYDACRAETGADLPWGTLTGIRPTKIPMAMLETGETEEAILAEMRNVHRVSEEKSSLALEIAKTELQVLSAIDYENGYSMYIGIPFCPSTCLYCSFTSYPLATYRKKLEDYLQCLFRELDFTAEHFAGKHLNTIYIGGGTPTTLPPEIMDRLLTHIEEKFDLGSLLEFTVEAGRPDSITEEKLAVLLKHPVTRISINPQTMKAETLKILGRNHTPEQIREVYAMARSMGFDNINMDIIMGLPNETIEDVEETLREISEMDPDNLTVHSLALKRTARLNLCRENYRDLTFINTPEHMELAMKYARSMGMKPYYLYRQKNMAGNQENTGYARHGKAGIYNILIMEEKQTIVACGAGTVTKRVYPDGRIERCDNVKDINLYLVKIDEMIERKRTLFS